MSWNDDLEKLNTMIEKREGVFQSDHITHEDGEQALLQIDPQAFPQKIDLLLSSTARLQREKGGWRVKQIKTVEPNYLSPAVERIQALIDWKVGVFQRDLVTASDALQTVNALFDHDVSVVKMGLLLRDVPGTMKFRVYSPPVQVWVWAVRDIERYQAMHAADLRECYHGA